MIQRALLSSSEKFTTKHGDKLDLYVAGLLAKASERPEMAHHVNQVIGEAKSALGGRKKARAAKSR